ncbi:MAG: T9SS type A sorting domain-containing protein, partial [Flavobacterium sp.]
SIYGFNGAIDDLKIYNYALTDAQVSQLYNNNTLSTSDFDQNNLEVALYPNPVQDILNINVDNAIKSVEIYNIQGQKVLNSTSNEVDMSSLNSGIYLVKITDENNSIATKKVVKR